MINMISTVYPDDSTFLKVLKAEPDTTHVYAAN